MQYEYELLYYKLQTHEFYCKQFRVINSFIYSCNQLNFDDTPVDVLD